MKRLWFDLETRSPIPINEGTYRYAEMVEILLFIYAFDDGEVAVWDVVSGAPMPAELHAALSDERVELAAHNVAFDRTVLMAACGDRYPLIPERFYCTMTAARMARMPGSLDALCKALELPNTYAKKDGKALIKKFCIPAPDGHYVQPYDDPGAWKRFVTYAIDDVVAMRECMKRIPDVLNATERALYGYTTRMNDRGIRIDKQLAVTCAHQAVKFKAQFKAEARRLTGDDEFNVISQQALLAYLRERGVFLEDARLSTLQDFLESEHATLLPMEVLKVLSTRLKANKAAVAKFPAVIKRLNRDDRLRGLIAHAGAGNTHRDTSVGPQFQNLARPVLLGENFTMEQACEIAKDGTAELYFEDPMQFLSDCVRGMVIPDPGKKLCVADLSNIEGRSVVWLAKEEWKLQYFRDFDAGRIRFDNYVMAYAKAFGIEPKAVSKAQRQVGKVMELAFSYGGSIGAFITFAAIYRVDLDAMSLAVREAGDPALWKECESSFDWFEEKKMTYGLSLATWTGCYYLVKAWRAAHSEVVDSWTRSEEMFKAAIRNPGNWFEALNGCHFFNNAGWVFARLPSGRMMVFPMAREEQGTGKSSITFMGVNSFTRKWGVQRTYGGRLVENFTQSFARDVLLWSVPLVEAAGYPVVLRVHDEFVTETPDDPAFTGEGLAKLMSAGQPWCPGLPLAAVGEDLYRYQK